MVFQRYRYNGYARLEEGQGQSVMKLIKCSGFPEIYA